MVVNDDGTCAMNEINNWQRGGKMNASRYSNTSKEAIENNNKNKIYVKTKVVKKKKLIKKQLQTTIKRKDSKKNSE